MQRTSCGLLRVSLHYSDKKLSFICQQYGQKTGTNRRTLKTNRHINL